MTFALPPIAQLAERLMLDIEQAVRAFPRYHRYAAGSDLRAKALAIATLTHRAWRDRPRQREHAWNLVWAIDELKIQLQLCSRLHAFTSLAQFEALFRSARALGKQAGGWYRQLTGNHPKGQDAQGPAPVAQRAQLDTARFRSDPDAATVNPVAGFGSPSSEARERPSVDVGAFFMPTSRWDLCAARLALWRAAQGQRKLRRPSDRSSNPASSVSVFGSAGSDSIASEEFTMPPSTAADERTIRRALRILESRFREPGNTFCYFTASSFFRLRLGHLDREVFEVALLDTKHRLIAVERLFSGTIDSAEIHPRIVVRAAMAHNAAAVIAAHNHPSGVCIPSRADRTITARLHAALHLVDVRLLDHLVVTVHDAVSVGGE